MKGSGFGVRTSAASHGVEGGTMKSRVVPASRISYVARSKVVGSVSVMWIVIVRVWETTSAASHGVEGGTMKSRVVPSSRTRAQVAVTPAAM